MNTWFRNIVIKVNQTLGKKIERWNIESPDPEILSAYHSLSPISNAEVKHYTDALKWALDNRQKESIYNIALTGPYGSGKSSILKTFKQSNKNEDYVFLDISLATFKDEPILDDDTEKKESKKGEKDNGETTTKGKDDLLRLIELSILQQIFYHEEDRKIPDSRFKKIKSFKRKNLVWITSGIMASFVFGLNLFFPEQVQKVLKTHFPEWLESTLHWLSLIVFLAASALVIYRSIRLAYGLKVSKFKFHEAEIEIDKTISKSILNNHLDEILYFFEVTDYSVVLIEDLDRFRQAEIFTKLRELNLLINNSKKVNQSVVFIYAVRDEMFRDKDRTKFFDFIIPVIPVINSSNSNEKLAGIVSENQYGVSADLLDDLSFFIDDMRLLYNIMNEYHIYRLLLGDELIQDKLLAIIVYKNILPDDFVALSNGKGKLFELVNKKQGYIAEKIKGIEEQIAESKTAIKEINDELIEDEKELRMIYLGYYISQIAGFNKFIIKGGEKELVDIVADESLFNFIKINDVTYSYYYNSYGSWNITQTKSSLKFADIEKRVHADYTFDERVQLINNHYEGREEKLKQDISQMERQKAGARQLKLQEILNDKKLKIDFGEKDQQGLLLKILLQTGYIDEDYLDYISLFYEGSITKEDRSFLLSVKSQTLLGYEFKLIKMGNLIAKIRLSDFNQPYVLNYNLLDYLLTTPGLDHQLDGIISQLHDQNDYGGGFIEDYLNNGKHIDVFVKLLAGKWQALWQYISQHETLTKSRKDDYFKLIIENAEVTAINELSKKSNLALVISERADFLSLIPDESKLKKIIETLSIKFINIELSSAPKSLANFVCDHNHYKLIPEVLKTVIKYAGKYDEAAFTSHNYDAILESGYSRLTAYVQKCIDQYITDVYLMIEGYQDESEPTLVNLLNNKNINIENRKNIVQKATTVISSMAEVDDNELDDTLLEWDAIEPTWNNILTAYQRAENQITPAMISFFGESNHAKTLSSPRIDKDKVGHEDALIRAFILSLINEDALDDQLYDDLTLAIPYWYSITDINENLTCNKINILVKNQVISATPENFNALKLRCSGSQIVVIEVNAKAFLEKLAEYVLDESDLLAIIKSARFNIEQKNQIVTTLDASAFNFKSVAVALTKLAFENATFKIPQALLFQVLTTDFSTDNRIKLFNMNFRQFTKEQVRDIFKTFTYPYSDIGVRYTSPVLHKTEENGYLANNLKALNFIASIKDDRKGIKLVNFKK